MAISNGGAVGKSRCGQMSESSLQSCSQRLSCCLTCSPSPFNIRIMSPSFVLLGTPSCGVAGAVALPALSRTFQLPAHGQGHLQRELQSPANLEEQFAFRQIFCCSRSVFSCLFILLNSRVGYKCQGTKIQDFSS